MQDTLSVDRQNVARLLATFCLLFLALAISLLDPHALTGAHVHTLL